METFSYIFVRTDINDDCDTMREMYLAFRHILLEPQLRTRALDKGYAPLIPSIVAKVLNTIGNITCDGISVTQG
jgi:hypothetical protein